MAMNRRHARRRPLPDMMPFSVIDALVNTRSTPFPKDTLVVVCNPTMPPIRYMDFANLRGHVGMIGVGETAQISESQIDFLKRRRDELAEMVMQGFKNGDTK